VKLDLRIDAELKDALDKAGFADAEHFVHHSIRALLEVHRTDKRTVWPISFETHPATRFFEGIKDDHGLLQPFKEPRETEERSA
jgi:hypothetical protein